MTVQLNLSGKTALVTGSTSGIGFGIAKTFAVRGANIVMNGIEKPEDVKDKEKELKDAGAGDVFYSHTDMSKPDAVASMISKAAEKYGSIDILVNNAGIQHVEKITKFDDKKWDLIIAINLSAAFHTIKHAAPYMIDRGWGRIINIASAHGLVASPYKAAYVAAKHGLLGLTKVAALDLAEHGITANAICPGYVDTPLVQKQIPEQAAEHHMDEDEVVQKVILKKHAIKEFIQVEELGELALFLCSDSAKHITGTHQSIDCGWTAQ